MTAVSHDKGKNWNDIKVDQSFPLSHQCDAGLVRLSWPREGKNRILYSKNESPQGRKNLVIRLSYDEGKTWHCVKTIDPGSAGYSDITVLPAKSFNKITDKTIIVIYESGKSLRCAVFSK
jgi:sialidase-1